ncbi:MAG: YihY/virulence factor BrkB family protein [Anaerolineales bacterium]
MKTRPSLKEFATELYRIWATERPGQLAAALAYYGMFAFAPVIFIAFWVAGLFIDQLSAANQFYVRLENFLGPDVAEMIQESVEAIASTTAGSSVIATLVSVVALLLAASGLFYQLQFALNKIWGVPPPESGQTTGLIRQRLFSFLMVIGVGLMLILASVVNVVISWFGSLFSLSPSMPVLNVLGFLGIATLAFALIFKILPEAEITWRDVWIGAIVTAILIALALFIFGAYLSRGNVGSAFEAAGAFAVLLIGIYTIAQVFLFGAMFTRVFAAMYGSKVEKMAAD